MFCFCFFFSFFLLFIYLFIHIFHYVKFSSNSVPLWRDWRVSAVAYQKHIWPVYVFVNQHDFPFQRRAHNFECMTCGLSRCHLTKARLVDQHYDNMHVMQYYELMFFPVALQSNPYWGTSPSFAKRAYVDEVILLWDAINTSNIPQIALRHWLKVLFKVTLRNSPHGRSVAEFPLFLYLLKILHVSFRDSNLVLHKLQAGVNTTELSVRLYTYKNMWYEMSPVVILSSFRMPINRV